MTLHDVTVQVSFVAKIVLSLRLMLLLWKDRKIDDDWLRTTLLIIGIALL